MISKPIPIEEAIKRLSDTYEKSKAPIISFMAAKGANEFTILIGTMLSARTRDSVTEKVLPGLFQKAPDASSMSKLETEEIAKLIYPVSFYKNKANSLKNTAQVLLEKFGGKVPQTMDGLLELPGVGRKTANLVLAEAFQVPAICVDTHVHRISNIWGIVQTKTPEETEMALMKILPKEDWIKFNPLLVSHGQTVCIPVSPICSQCVLNEICPKFGVTRQR